MKTKGSANAGRLTRRSNRDIAHYEERLGKKHLIVLGLVVLLVLAAIFALSVGSAGVGIKQVLMAFFGKTNPQTFQIVLGLRLPRVLTGLIAGLGLAIAGCVMQSVLGNPMASSSTLGVAQGAAFGASIGISLLGSGAATGLLEGAGIKNPYLVSACAFACSMLATITILTLSRIKSISPEGMILCGVAISAMFTGGTTMVQFFADEQRLASIVFWTFGDLSRTNLADLRIIALVVLGGSVFFFFNRWNYTALLTGDDGAKGLGVNVERIRLVSMTLATLMTAVIVAFIGIINFIGLIAPHILKGVLGNDYRFLIPGSALLGAILLLLSDVVGRVMVQPLVLPIGAITSFLGGPLFLYLLYRGNRS